MDVCTARSATRLRLAVITLIATVVGSASLGAVASAQSPQEQQAAVKAMYKQNWDLVPQATRTAGTNPDAAGASTQAAIGTAPGQTIYFGQVYGLRENNTGVPIGCNIEIVTDAPNPTLGIRYGLELQCNDSSISGQGISHLGEFFPTPLRPLQAGSFFSIYGDNQFYWRTQEYTRESETQFEQIYAFFSVTINTPNGVWKTTPTVGGAAYDIQCAGLGTRQLTCAMATLGFPFFSTSTNCGSGSICGPSADPCGTGGVRDAALRAVDASALDDDPADAAIDAAVGLGDPDDLPDAFGPDLPDPIPAAVPRSVTACAAKFDKDSLQRNGAEIRYCAVTASAVLNPFLALVYARRARACYHADRARNEAQREQYQRFTKPSENRPSGRADAFRHCTWSGRMVHRLNAKWATKFGDLHEQKPNNPPEERAMDQYNNSVGRELGAITKAQAGRARALYIQCELAARNGSLQVNNP